MGLCVIGRRRHGFWLSHDLILPYLLGSFLVGAGLATLLGDRLWIGDNYRIIPPADPNHSRISRGLSLTLIFAGALLTAVSLAIHFGLLPRP